MSLAIAPSTSDTSSDERVLSYTLHDSSSHSGKYVPENIQTNDHSTRWSGINTAGAFHEKQWITLRLDDVALLKQILFGKSKDKHPCNMKEFKVFAGLALGQMTEILHTGLMNDPIPEAFSVRHKNSLGYLQPCRFVTIVPLAPHQAGYNTSIWFVELRGISDSRIVSQEMERFEKFREQYALRVVAKHLRSRELPYADILLHRNVQLEHPLVSRMFDALVTRGDFTEAEETFDKVVEGSLTSEYLRSTELTAMWETLSDTSGRMPSPRSGHQMVLDTVNKRIFLFGGWTGTHALADLWSYSIYDRRWTCISQDVSLSGGPSPRTCHAMVFDRTSRCLFILGKLVEATSDLSDGTETYQSDFWQYSTAGDTQGKWMELSRDTKADGGPALIFDLGMAIDSAYGVIVVFGGKIVNKDYSKNPSKAKCSGMYTYDLAKNTWKLEFEDPVATTTVAVPFIPSRSGHGLILDELSRTIFVFGGQRGLKPSTSDLWSFSLRTKEVKELCRDCSAVGGPDPGISQRMMIDQQLKEIYVLTGLSTDRDPASDAVQRTCWVYRLISNSWHRVTEPESGDMDVDGGPFARQSRLPSPRFAHQVVYDPARKLIFLFGGSDGGTGSERLGDFWTLSIARPNGSEVLRRAKLLIRKQQFREISARGVQPAVDALYFLQTRIQAVVNHKDATEIAEFHELVQELLRDSLATSSSNSFLTASTSDETLGAISSYDELTVAHNSKETTSEPPSWRTENYFAARYAAFQRLIHFINADAKEPEPEITDWIIQDNLSRGLARWY